MHSLPREYPCSDFYIIFHSKHFACTRVKRKYRTNLTTIMTQHGIGFESGNVNKEGSWTSHTLQSSTMAQL